MNEKKFIKRFKNTNQFSIFVYWMAVVVSIVSLTTLLYVSMEKFDKQYVSSSTISGKKIQQILFGFDCDKVAEEVKEEISKIEEELSSDVCESDIYLINNSNCNWVKIRENTLDALSKVIEISKNTEGIYDPTYLNLIEIYEKNNTSEIKHELKNVNYKFIELNKKKCMARIKNRGTFITLNDIIDGFSCNKAIELYKIHKINKATIQIGNCTGYYNYEEKDNQNPKNGFVCVINKNESIINAKSGEKVENSIKKSFYHPSDAILACILAKIKVLVTEEKFNEICNGFK